ncbi:MAG: DUF86 domain-containing protein [Anaerolineae bacterium]
MSRSYRLYLQDMFDATQRISEYSQHMDFQDFLGNRMAYDAILRNLEIIGEAAKNVPTEVRQRYPQVEWRRIAGLRDIMAHTYYALDDETIWDIVENQVSELYEQVSKILEGKSKES